MNRNWKVLLDRLLQGESFEDLPEVFKRVGKYLLETKTNPVLRDRLLEFIAGKNHEERNNPSAGILVLTDWHVGNRGWQDMAYFEQTMERFKKNLRRFLSRYTREFRLATIDVVVLGDMMEYMVRKEDILGEWLDMSVNEKLIYAASHIIDVLEIVKEYSVANLLWITGNHSRVEHKVKFIRQDSLEDFLSAQVLLGCRDIMDFRTENEYGYLARQYFGRKIVFEHGHLKYSSSNNRPSYQSIIRRFFYLEDAVDNVDALVIGHYHNKIVMDVNKNTFIVAPSLIPTSHYASRRGLHTLPKQMFIVVTQDENTGRLKLSPIVDIWG